MEPSISDIEAARKRIHRAVLTTPMIPAHGIESPCTHLLAKCENFQHTGSFKLRGACNGVFSLSESDAARGVVTHSSGNFAAAVARAARIRGINASVVMPGNSSPIKIANVRREGCEPVLCDIDKREETADAIVAETGGTLLHPYDAIATIAGQGTAGLEIVESGIDIDTLIIPVGGGGLLSGVLIAMKSLAPKVEIIAAEPARADDAKRSLASGKIELPEHIDTLADGLRTSLGNLTFPIIRHYVDGILLASEEAIARSTSELVHDAKLVVEPSGAVPLAVIRSHPNRFAGKRVCILLSGGNLDFDNLPWQNNS